ncbi:hypothetical protein [Nocardia tengchongensis]|uniref:hypothetical protein n=1 Tax=Nocardia tengchongensis TaxID=2055889 RepID=UPI00360BEDC3
MRIITSRCHAFEYTVTAPSPCAIGLDTAQVGAVNRFSDCLVVTIAMEHGDRAVGSVAVKLIRRIAAQTGATAIVVDGYLRPPSRSESARPRIDVLAELADALDLLTEIADLLVSEGGRIHVIPFGWRASTHADIANSAHAQRSIRLGVDDPALDGGVVAALDVPVAQRFREKSSSPAATVGA